MVGRPRSQGDVAANLDLAVGYQAGGQLMRALGHGFLAAEHTAGTQDEIGGREA